MPFSIAMKAAEKIGKSAIKKLDDRTKIPVNKKVSRNKKFSDIFLLLLHESNTPQNSRSIELIRSQL